MPVISDRLTDGAKLGRGAQIVFYARGLRDSVDGDAILTQARTPVPVDPETGLFTTPNLEPGPYWCGIKWAAAQSFENFQIVIGDSDTRLWPLLEEALPYTPAQESLFKQYRDEVAEFVTTAEGLSTAQDEAVADLVAPGTATKAALDGTYAPLGSGGSSTALEIAARFGEGYFTDMFAAPPASDLPTITLATSDPLGGTLIREKRVGSQGPTDGGDLAGDTHFRYDGMPALIPSPSGPSAFLATDLLPNGAAQNAKYLTRVETITDRTNSVVVIPMRAMATTAAFRVSVDGRWVTQQAIRYTGLTVGTTYFIVVTFPVARKRHLLYEQPGSGSGFGGMIVPVGQSLARPTTPIRRRVAIGGDSYTGGAQDVSRIETYAAHLAKLLGADSYWNFGIGGSGWVTAPAFETRIDAMLACDPDVVVWLGSQNDSGATAVYAAALAALTRFADVPEVYVSGPSWPGASAVNEQVRAAAIDCGRIFIDGAAAQWVTPVDQYPTDANHVQFSGHRKIARGFYDAIRATMPVTAIAASTPSTPGITSTVTILATSPVSPVLQGESVTLTATVT
ncbi:SGNH/GDSL hydrolase family protein, partial [Streptomyces luteogriseus]